jgi:Cu2+-exporting ATPase
VRSPNTFSADDRIWVHFVERVFAVPEVESVEIDRARDTATVGYTTGSFSPYEALDRISAALREPPELGGASVSKVCERVTDRSRFRLVRRDGRISTWQLVHERAGRLRLRDVALKDRSDQLRQVCATLRALKGVFEAVSNAWTGSVLVRFNPAIIGRDEVLSRIDCPRANVPVPIGSTMPAGTGEWAIANCTLGIAAAGEFLVPALLPLSAVLLVTGNLTNFRDAWRQLRERRVGVPLLQTAIVAATLATSGFVAASLMNWLLTFWEKRRKALAASGHKLLSAAIHRPRNKAWLCREGTELETPADQLRPGDVVVVRAGESVPVDGKIVSGTAILEEHPAKGVVGLICRGPGAMVLEGSFVVEGELRLAVERSGKATYAGNIDHAISFAEVAGEGDMSAKPPAIAERAVPPVLVTAGVGLLVGDATAAAAILRPDYASGPKIGDSLTQLFQLAKCLDEGILIRRGDVLARMADADLLLLDHEAALETRRPALADVEVTGELNVDELLRYGECALRPFHDPRSFALSAACRQQSLRRCELPLKHRPSWIEICDQGRCLRVEGLAARTLASPADSASSHCEACLVPDPLGIYCNGRLAGVLTFSRGNVLAAKDVVFDLRDRCRMQVEMLAESRSAQMDELVDALGADGMRVCPVDESKANYIHDCRREGHRVAYVGDGLRNPLAAAAADVAVSIRPDPARHDDPSGVWLLEPDYAKLSVLRDIAQSHRRQLQWHYGITLAPNVACIAGAIFLGFTSLAAVILSNLGTYTVYMQSVADLRRAERRLRDRRQPSAGRLPAVAPSQPLIGRAENR